MDSTATFIAILFILAAAISPANGADAPAPSSGPPDIVTILKKGQQYTTLLKLLSETHVTEQIQSQLDQSSVGLTVLAPTDNAFRTLKGGTLNKLSSQDQVALVLYHVLPDYYTLESFQTASNPVRTQSSGNNGVYAVNITSAQNQVNVSTGVVQTQLNNVLYSEFPLAVYSLETVLLPYDLFGPKPPAPAAGSATSSKSPEESGESSSDSSSSSSAARLDGSRFAWSLVGGLELMCFASLSMYI